MTKYPEYKNLDLPSVAQDVLAQWERKQIFEQSISNRAGKPSFVFYEGPPSANGLPGIHHVMARSIKDIFCRYKTLKGYQVKRKAGWDTHGLPVELGVEKALGITKEDIGKSISVEQYNEACKKDVMKYTHVWNDLTRQMGYWVDMENPYITYENKYIESVWWLLSRIYNKGLLYKGYTIQPYSPAAGTGLSTHELNQPGCYRNVKDRTAVAMFKAQPSDLTASLCKGDFKAVYFLAWTTTPWTLPSNTALAVGKDIKYSALKTFNPFTHQPVVLILANDLQANFFPVKNAELALQDYKAGDKAIPYEVIAEFTGKELEGQRYEQLLPFTQPTDGDAFKVVVGDFVTTTDGTGIVHIAPSFGADDFRVAKQNGIGSLTLVDKRGKFSPEVQDGIFLYGEEYVKEAYLTEEEKEAAYKQQKSILEKEGKIKELKAYLSVDERIVLKLQEEGKLFKKETYEHSYPHCWRTDKPILYYPLDSWFIKTTEYKEQMIALNQTINWKPESTGTGRFGNWLENLNDWNLSRSRYWGIPIPIWSSEDGSERICISSIEELQKEVAHAVSKGVMANNPLEQFKPGDFSSVNYELFDLHKPTVDTLKLERNGKTLTREADLIDVWFDSGAMPFAQMHFPFEQVAEFAKNYPADFIAEGVDQTRGWFFTLHAISSLVKSDVHEVLKANGIPVSEENYPGVAFKSVVSNGLVLDKDGNKMSKRLGNAVDPFTTLKKYGADATRWYMITNAQPWDNLKFDVEGIGEVQRKFFGTLYNTYNFFAVYANIDGFSYKEAEVPLQERPELDRWILSELNTLIQTVDQSYAEFEPTRAGRAMEQFVDEHLSNWYVRLCRRRFWKGEYSQDKIAAYQTLYTCLETLSILAAPIAPFFMDRLFQDLNGVTLRNQAGSVHLADYPAFNADAVDQDLEQRMELAQQVSSMVLSIRKKENIKVRQPLNKIQIPVLDERVANLLKAVAPIILSEVNVKELECVGESDTQIVKSLKLNFKTLGKKCGKHMKAVQQFANEHAQTIIAGIEKDNRYAFTIENDTIELAPEDVEIIPVDIPGWKVANNGPLTVALDITLTEGLKEEGLARELVNRIQNLRKDKDFEITDKISLKIQRNNALEKAVNNNLNYICAETLATSLELVDLVEPTDGQEVEVDEHIKTIISIHKLN